MCSLSWFKKDNQVIIFFSRDEMLTRSRAKPPAIIRDAKEAKNLKESKVLKEPTEQAPLSIMPIDQDAGGSWLSINQSGVFIGLLNAYPEGSQKPLATKTNSHLPISRGQVIIDLARATSLRQLQNYFSNSHLKQYKPFKLVFISQQQQQQFYWNGEQVEMSSLPPFLSSSSYSNQAVVTYRQQLFAKLKNIDRNKLLQFHQNHYHIDPAFSVCMHREEAKTVSLSEIQLTDEKVSYRYWDGSPCIVDASEVISLDRSYASSRISNLDERTYKQAAEKMTGKKQTGSKTINPIEYKMGNNLSVNYL